MNRELPAQTRAQEHTQDANKLRHAGPSLVDTGNYFDLSTRKLFPSLHSQIHLTCIIVGRKKNKLQFFLTHQYTSVKTNISKIFSFLNNEFQFNKLI